MQLAAKCYGEDGRTVTGGTLSNAEIQANCVKYGRLYDWVTAMALPSSCNSSICDSQVNEKHRGICPSGWHIPNDADWNVLIEYIGTSCDNLGCSDAGTKLKATSDWESCSSISGDGVAPSGSDTYGFAALPGGIVYSDGSFYNVGYNGYWWSASELNVSLAYIRYMSYNGEDVIRFVGNKSNLFSVRCLQD